MASPLGRNPADRVPINILLVDDQPAKLLSYEVILRDLNERLITATSADEALSILLKTEVAVILVDVCMPDLDGFELVRIIREHPRFQNIAIIFVSAILLTDLDRIKGYEFGAVDYVPVPVVPEILQAKVRVFAQLYRKARELEQAARDLEQIVAERTAELEATAARLRKSEEQLRQALGAAKMGTWRHDLVTQTSDADPNLNLLLGNAAESTTSPTEQWLALIHEDDVETVTQAWQRAVVGRDAYEAEIRIKTSDGSQRWLREQGNYVPGQQGQPGYLTGLSLDITERRQAEEARTLLIEELNHRVKNMLAMVQSIAAQSITDDLQKERLLSRIRALAIGHNLLTQSQWKGASLKALLESLGKPYDTPDSRLSLSGADVVLSPRDSINVCLAVHELLTNAVKHGAYSSPEGRITISWTVEPRSPRSVLQFLWVEEGPDEIRRTAKPGFGTRLLTSLAAQPNGKYTCQFEGRTLRCELTLPIETTSV